VRINRYNITASIIWADKLREVKKINTNYLKRLSAWLNHFARDTRAKITPKTAIMLSIAFFVASIVMPIGILEASNTNVTGWTAPVVTIFQTVFPILGVISLALMFLPGET